MRTVVSTLLGSALLCLGGACTSQNSDFDGFGDGNGGVYNAALCPGSGPTWHQCSGGPAAIALGVCGDLDSPNTLEVRAVGGGEPANLAVNGRTKISSPLRVDGAFYGQGTIEAPNTMDVRGDLVAGDDWIVSSPARVDGDASIVGTLDARNNVTVGGVLTAGEVIGAGQVASADLQLGGASFSPPMVCNAAPRAAQIAAAIAAGDVDDDALVGLPRNALVDIREPTVVTLGCGQYRLDSLTANNTLTLRVVGPTVLLIDGDVRIASPTDIRIEDGGSLELVIRGSLQADNTLVIGDEAHPAWTAIGGAIRIASPTRIYGSVLAPDSAVAADNTLFVRGGALFGSLRVASPLQVEADYGLTAEGCVADQP